MINLIEKLEKRGSLELSEYNKILSCDDTDFWAEVSSKALEARKHYYEDKIFIRGLIEFTNYCKNDCLYCGIRCSNHNAVRYRLSEEEILSCCKDGYNLGFRTFVLQGGEDGYYTEDKIAQLIDSIKTLYPDCAVTLSVGEHSYETYLKWFNAGADRYLLRHETADEDHYKSLHPSNLSYEHRMQCLYDLKDIGYQVGCGFMVGSPGQTLEHLSKDLFFIQNFKPDMVGIGPFIPHCDTPFRNMPTGELHLTLRLLSIIRLILPNVLLPSTTALSSIHPEGRELGILAGANVCMPNLSPEYAKENYTLYNNKLSEGSEAARNIADLDKRMKSIGYQICVDRGDHKSLTEGEKNV